MLREGLGATEQFRRSDPDRRFVRSVPCSKQSPAPSCTSSTNEAFHFYTDTLGLEVAADVDLGFMRWLTVCVPGDPGREILLEKPGLPSMDETTATQVADLVSKGVAGGNLFLTTSDAHATFEMLRERGVDITDEPAERPYGIDFGIRDPFGNAVRIGQMFHPKPFNQPRMNP